LLKNVRRSESEDLLRKARSLFTQEELSLRVGCSRRTISRWENGQTRLPFYAGLALEKILSEASSLGSADTGDFTFIDLFAGIGGIRLGFERAGGRCVFTSEWDEHCKKSYRANFPDNGEIAGDITKVEASSIPDHDILLAGFPCQPFSIAGVSKKNALGRPHGFDCETQGTLFFDVVRILAEKRPFAFLLENVKNLLSHDKGRTFRVIRDTLVERLGYEIYWKVIDGRRFVPQHRERIVIAGFREPTVFDWEDAPLPEIGPESPRLGSILHSEDGLEFDRDDGRFLDEGGRVRPKYTLSDKLWDYLQDYAEKHRARGNGFGFGLVEKDGIARTLSARYYKDGSEILVDRGREGNPRRLTPRECARLMGFPDRFRIVVSDTQAYKQFGNSVVVPLMEYAARAMKPHVMRMKAERSHSVGRTFRGAS